MSRPSSCNQTQCIVLTPRASVEDELLHTALRERDWEATCVHEPLEAMLEIARIERAQQSRACWGLKRTEQVSLTIVQPGKWDSLDELVNALSRFFPFVSVWLFDGRHVTTFGGERDAETPVQIEREDASDERQQQGDDEDVPDASVVTRDELDMLLEVSVESESNS